MYFYRLVFQSLLLALLLLVARDSTAADPVGTILSVDPVGTDINAEPRVLTRWHPARFQVVLKNRTDAKFAGGLVGEVIGHLDTVYGLPAQKIELAPREKRAVTLTWSYPGRVTYEGMPMGPVTVPGAVGGLELRVAWQDGSGQVTDRASTVFAVDREGTATKNTLALAKSPTLTPRQAFHLRYAGYLDNPGFMPTAAPEDLTLTLEKGRIASWASGQSPSGCLTYLARLDAVTASTPATVRMKKEHLRLQRAFLLDPNNPAGPRGQRFWHRGDQKDFVFVLPPTGGDAVLVLELERGQYVAPVPLAEMVATADKQFGKFPSMLADRAGKPISTAAHWAEHRKLLQQAIRKSLGSALDTKPVPLDPIVVSEDAVAAQAHINGVAGPYVRRKVSIRVNERERMNVWLLVPPGMGPFPAVIAHHQTVAEGKDEPAGLGGNHYQLNFGPFLVSRGFVVAAPDSYGAGERMAPGSTAYDTTTMEAKDPAWSLLGQRLHDHIRVIDFVQTLRFVDPDRIGAIGHSLGGESTAVLTAMDERIQVAVVSCPGTLMRSLDNAADTYTAKGSMILSPNFRKLLEPPVKQRRLPFDFDDFIALWAPRPVFVHAVKDDLWPNAPQMAQAYHAARDLYGWHGAAGRLAVHYSAQTHCFPEWVQKDGFDWLEYWLKRQN